MIELHDHETEAVQRIEWDWKDWQKELPVRTRLVAELYERYAEGAEGLRVKGEQQWPGLRDALARLEELDKLWEQYDEQVKTAGKV